MKKCEVCGKELPESEFSKSYKKRCKKCVAEMTKAKRNQAPTFKDLQEIESTSAMAALCSMVDCIGKITDAFGKFVDTLIAEAEKNGGAK
jgi:hypothetical protein